MPEAPSHFPSPLATLALYLKRCLFFLLEISTRLSEQQLMLGQNTWHSLQMVKCKQMSSAVSVTEFARIHSVPASVPMLSPRQDPSSYTSSVNTVITGGLKTIQPFLKFIFYFYLCVCVVWLFVVWWKIKDAGRPVKVFFLFV